MAITSYQLSENVQILNSCIVTGQLGLNNQINQICIATNSEELLNTKFDHCLIISTLDLFTLTTISDYFETLAKNRRISCLILTTCNINIKTNIIYKLCSSYNIPLFCLPQDTSQALVINNVLEYYTKHIQKLQNTIKYDYANLVNCITLDQGISQIIKQAAKMLGNPLVLTDESYNLVGYSSAKEVYDPVWQKIISSGYCSIDIVKVLRHEGFEKQLKEASPLFLTSGDFSRYIRRLVTEIRIDDQLKGYMALLEYERPITSLDQDTLTFVASIVALEVSKLDTIAKARGSLVQELLKDLAEGNIDSESIAHSRVISLEWILGKYLQVVIICNKENHHIDAEYYSPIKSIISKSFPHSKASFTSNAIVVLASGNTIDFIKDTLFQIEKFCKLHSLCLGIGRTYNTLLEVSVSYKEAEKALLLATSLNRAGYIHYYEDLAVYTLLENVKSNYKIHPSLLNLIEYDKKEKTDYIKTLSIYLSCYQNVSHTAVKLFLHRNTVLYRIKKIEKILQRKLDNHSFCLELELEMLMISMK
ncbi:helix-turn-helix domain-containing protein [Clostridium sp.]|uniref:PucR family transcriptional regulator n=1 Tax=Clostridium sp. TaxID=1506 RepID=UPI001A3D5167|nr:helix-turn-helix domain-containing protein [Clostridium sp.]MBK5242732.1 helix-turn-helix domain-containing protein [Clostridium sp.]